MKILNLSLLNSPKKIAWSFILVLLGLASVGFSQTTPVVNISVAITPPYSPYYSDYSGQNAAKVLLLLTNTSASQLTIKLTGQLEGDNGIKITTKSNYVPASPIVLNPRQTVTLNGLALKDIFDLNSLNVYGVDKSRLIYTSRLPEGNYSFCIQAVNMSNNQVVSSTAPLGCTSITIAYPDAPVLVSPMANTTLTPVYPQQQQLTWINAGFVPANTQYILQIAEMPLTNADPNQVLNATSFPLVNKTVFGTSTVLSAIDAPLKIGKRYAWRVKAIDPTGQTVFKNDGISRAFQFRYGDEIKTPSIITLQDPKNNQKIDDLTKLNFSWNFTDNSASQDPVVLSNIGMISQPNKNLFRLHVTRIKSDEELKKEKASNLANANGSAIKEDAVVLDVYAKSISYKNATALSSFLKDQNNYKWYVEHPATNTKSELRYFTVQLPKQLKDYQIQLAGRLKYRYYDDDVSYNSKTVAKKLPGGNNIKFTEAENGYILANTPIQALRVTLTVPIYTVKRKVKVMENGVAKEYTEDVDSIPTLSNLRDNYKQAVKTASVATIMSGTTDAMGNFNLTVPISKNLFKIVDNNVKYPPANTRRAIVEGIVIKVNDQRYSDPSWFIFPTDNQTSVALNEEVVQIYDYKLDISFNTKVQRNYKGKMYLLKSDKALVKGEVDNLVGEMKDITTISKAMYDFPGNKNKYNYSHSTLSVVGVKNVNGQVSANSGLSVNFSKLASNYAGNTSNYVVYFEPDESFSALYFSPEKIANSNLKSTAFESTVFHPLNATEKTVLGPKYLSMTISGRYLYKWKSPSGKVNPALPLPKGTKLTLVKGYLTSKSLIKDLGSELLEQKKVATTTVGDNGNYTFDLGLLNYDAFNADGGKNMVIVIDDPYYASEPEFVAYNQNENVQLPDLTAIVRQFKFTSRLLYKKDGNMLPANQMDIYLCRLKNASPATIPVNEGDPAHKDYFKPIYKHTDGKEYEIIDKTVPNYDGTFTFNRLVLPSNDINDAYYILAEPQSTSNDNYLTEEPFPLTGVMKFWSIFTLGSFGQQMFTDATEVLDSKYTANGQYVLVVPQVPYIDGAVYPYSNTATSVLSGVKVELFDMNKNNISPDATFEQFESYFNVRKPIDEQITGSNGRFLFNKFYESLSSRTQGKMLRLTKSGFLTTYKPIEGGIPIAKGRRANLGKVYLDLPVDLTATVQSYDGKAVPARIVVGDDFSWTDTYSVGPVAYANLKSPKGKVKFTVIPSDLGTYQVTTSEVTIDPKKSTKLTLYANKNMHSIGVIVLDKNTLKSVPANIYVTNIKETPGIEKYASNGVVQNVLEFSSAGSQFDIKVVPTGNYTIAKTQVKSDMTKPANVTVYVEPAVSLNVSVTSGIGKYKAVVTDYHIVIDDLDEDEYLVTKRADGLGSTISKIPYMRWLTIGVSKKGYIGQDQAVLTNSAKSLEFSLTDAANYPIDNLYGFPIELTGAGKLNDGSFLVSGRLNPAGSSNASNLTLKDKERWLRFNNVRVTVQEAPKVPKGALQTKATVYVQSDVVFDETELEVKLFNKFDAFIKDNGGLSLQGSGTSGSLMGRIAIDPASMSAGVSTNMQAYAGENYYLYLNKLETEYVPISTFNNTRADRLRTFTTDVSDVKTPTMMVSNISRKIPHFNIVDGFTVFPEGKIVFANSGISTKAYVNTTLANVSNQKDNVLKGTFYIGADTYSFSQRDPLKIKLRDWQLEFSDWNLTKAGFQGTGNLNALGLTIPFSKLRMTTKAIGFGNFDVKQLTLLNKFPVNINANEVMTSFGFDKGYSVDKGAWSVAILANTQTSSLAALSGLPDIWPTDKIYINNINLYDTGNPNDTRILLTETQPAVTLNGIAKFKPFSVFGGLDFMSFRGSLDMDIPNLTGLGNVTYDLKYKVENGNFVHVHDMPFKNLALDVNGVKVQFSESGQIFNNGVLKLIGQLIDKDPTSKYKIAVQLDKSMYGTRLHLPEGTPTPQRVYLSGNTNSKNYLDNATGEMSVIKNQWNNFTFSGDMAGADGINAGDSRLSFTVKGDIVANNSKIGVQNMEAGGMKGINFAYDFKESALIGSASISQSTDFADLTMDIDLKIGSQEWYVFSNCLANNIKNSPFSQAAAGIMLGNATLNGNQIQSLHKHFKDNDIPTNFDNYFKSVKGILMVMSADLPIPIIPTFDLNLDPVAHASLTHGIYGNLYFNAGFSLKKEELSLAIGARLGAFVKLGVGASIGLACAGINLHADVHADASGKLVPFAPPGQRLSIDAGIKFTLEGSAYVGAGVCDSNCETPCVDAGFFDICSPIPCFKKGLSKTIVLGLEANVTDASPYFHFKGLKEL